MARKTKENTEYTHAALIDAAEQMFLDKGVASTTLAEIAAAAGMTRGAIYWHFKDKAALIQAMCERATLPMESLLNELAQQDLADPLAAMRTLSLNMLMMVVQSERQQRVFTILFHRCEKNGELATTLAQEQKNQDKCLGQLQQILDQAVRKKQLPPDTDTKLAMHVANAFLIGCMHQWLESPGNYDLARSAAPMVDCMIAGLLANPPRRLPALVPASLPASLPGNRQR